jgi:hypothetical protein
MVSSGLLHRVALVWFLQEPHGITTQKTPFFIVTAVKTSNLTLYVSLILIQLILNVHDYLLMAERLKCAEHN